MDTNDVMGSRTVAHDLLNLAEATRALFTIGGEIDGEWVIAAFERASAPVPPSIRDQVQAIVSSLSRLERTVAGVRDAGEQG